MNSETGKGLVLVGVLIVLIGVVIYFFHDKLHWIGRLPGDIRIEKENFRFYFPLMTMLIFSLVATVAVHFIRKFLS